VLTLPSFCHLHCDFVELAKKQEKPDNMQFKRFNEDFSKTFCSPFSFLFFPALFVCLYIFYGKPLFSSNCSSLCTKVVRHPVVLDVFPEGHCFPGVHSPKETDWLMIFSCHRALTTEVDRAHKVQGNSFFTVSILQKQYLGSV